MMTTNYDNKLDNMCYNNNLLISFLPLWVPSVNAYLLKTGPEACSERETDAPSPHSHRSPPNMAGPEVCPACLQPQRWKETSSHSILNIVIMKRLKLQSGGGFFLTLPPGDNHVWPIEGLPINKTDNSSLKRESIIHALFSHRTEDMPPPLMLILL